MSKKYPPKNYDMIGDPARTEGAASSIAGGGKGRTFRKDNEGFPEMQKRRLEEGETAKKGSAVEEINKQREAIRNQPNALKEAKDKLKDSDKSPDNDPKPNR